MFLLKLLRFLVDQYYFCTLQDDASASNGNKDPLSFDGMADTEVERRLKVIYDLWNCWVYV
jgi:hypothetical protein